MLVNIYEKHEKVLKLLCCSCGEIFEVGEGPVYLLDVKDKGITYQVPACQGCKTLVEVFCSPGRSVTFSELTAGPDFRPFLLMKGSAPA